MKKSLMSLSLACILAGCSSQTAPDTAAEPTPEATAEPTAEATATAETAQIDGMANPWTDVSSAEEAIEISGVEFQASEVVGDFTVQSYRAMEGLNEVIYSDGETEMRFRAGLGEEDNSGDYNTYKETRDQDITGLDGVTAHVSGNDGLDHLIWWTQDGKAYSLTSEKGLEHADTSVLLKMFAQSEVSAAGAWTEVTSAEEAAAVSGVDFKASEVLGDFTVQSYRAMEGLNEVVYSDGKSQMVFRAGLGEEDNSGDMNTYSETRDQIVAGYEINVHISGNDGLDHLAWWTNNGNAYSLTSEKGLEHADTSALLKMLAQ